MALRFQHLFRKVAQAVTGSLHAVEAAVERKRLAGQHAGKLVAQALILPKQVADFARAHADIARRHIGIGANIFVQLGHEALAKTHDLSVGLAFWIEIAAALAAANGQPGQRVFENLLKAQELDDPLVYGRVEP